MDDATRKAAVLIAALDRSSADALLARMDPERAQRIRNALMELEPVSDREERTVLADFLGKETVPVAEDNGIELEASLAEKLSAPTPNQYFADEDDDGDRTDGNRTGTEAEPFRFLHEATTDSLATHLRSENPQVVAVVVAHLPPERAADLIRRLAPHLQVDVLRRVAELDRTDAETIAGLGQSLQLALADEIRTAKNRSSGVAAVASILAAAGPDSAELRSNLVRHHQDLASWLDSEQESGVLPIDTASAKNSGDNANGALSERTHLTDKETDQRVAIHDRHPAEQPAPELPSARGTASPVIPLWELSEQELVRLLPAAPRELMLLALAGAPAAFVAKVLKPLAPQQRRDFHRKMAKIGPLRLSDIEEAQHRVAAIAARLRSASRPHRTRIAA